MLLLYALCRLWVFKIVNKLQSAHYWLVVSPSLLSPCIRYVVRSSGEEVIELLIFEMQIGKLRLMFNVAGISNIILDKNRCKKIKT